MHTRLTSWSPRAVAFATCLLVLAGLGALPARAATLTYAHVASDGLWETGIGLRNIGASAFDGTLTAYAASGAALESLPVFLEPGAAYDLLVGETFADPGNVASLAFTTEAADVAGFATYTVAGVYRAAVPASLGAAAGALHLAHIASDGFWWTGIALKNTTDQARTVTCVFNTGETASVALAAGEHKAFTVASLFGGAPRPDLASAEIVNAQGVAGIVLYGSETMLAGLALSGASGTLAVFPHVVGGQTWKTGVVIYNPGQNAANLTIHPYGNGPQETLAVVHASLPAGGKLVGEAQALGLPKDTAWCTVESSEPVVAFELFLNGESADALACTATGGAAGVLPRKLAGASTIVGIVNQNVGFVAVDLAMHDAAGAVIAETSLPLIGKTRVLAFDDELFKGHDISNGASISYTARTGIVCFEVGQSQGWKELDALPAILPVP